MHAEYIRIADRPTNRQAVTSIRHANAQQYFDQLVEKEWLACVDKPFKEFRRRLYNSLSEGKCREYNKRFAQKYGLQRPRAKSAARSSFSFGRL